jgi:hypothetical protein
VAQLLSGLFEWLLRQGLTLLLILLVLLGAAWLRGEWKGVAGLTGDRAIEVAKRDTLAASIHSLTRKAAVRSELVQQNLGSVLDRKQSERQALSDRHFWASRVPLSSVWQDIKLLDGEIAFYQNLLNQAKLKDSAGRALVMQLEQDLQLTSRRIEDIDRELAKSPVTRLREELPLALAILTGIVFLPIGIKVFFYFVIAPLAANREPIRLLPFASGRVGSPILDGVLPNGGERVSAVSIPILLDENQEMLIQPEYLQSISLQARKTTKWLLNSRIPFTSLLSGMFMLTRVGPAGSEPVVISATKDPLSEIGIVDLADGAAFVCQPRALAGVVQDRERPISITRHWRLGSLQGWLTLQLRFLVFHGPGQLILKGCRGIRMEQAGKARTINQAATLGFSANVSYANTRCETFVSYWAGKEDLFNDLFVGEAGVYVYEETPDLRRASGIGRPLQGFADAVLKVFGV